MCHPAETCSGRSNPPVKIKYYNIMLFYLNIMKPKTWLSILIVNWSKPLEVNAYLARESVDFQSHQTSCLG